MFRFQSDSRATSLFAFHDEVEEDARSYVLKAVEAPTLGSGDITLLRITGPRLAGLNARWQRWSLNAGAPDVLVPPCLSEDPDDLAYTVRSGLVVTVLGSTTAYVVCGGPGGELDEPRLTTTLCRFAENPLWAPVGCRGGAAAVVLQPK